jgi:hypothetical protein
MVKYGNLIQQLETIRLNIETCNDTVKWQIKVMVGDGCCVCHSASVCGVCHGEGNGCVCHGEGNGCGVCHGEGNGCVCHGEGDAKNFDPGQSSFIRTCHSTADETMIWIIVLCQKKTKQ